MTGTQTRVLGVAMVAAAVLLLLLIFVIPAYTTEECGGSVSVPGTAAPVTCASGAQRLLAVNPGALPVLLIIVAMAVAIAALGFTTTWSRWWLGRRLLTGLLLPFSALALLAGFSIGLWMLPLAALGWVAVVAAGR